VSTTPVNILLSLRGDRQVQAGLSRVAVASQRVGAALGAVNLAGVFSAAAMLAATRSSIRYASALTDTAAATQTNVEALQVLNALARDAGARQEQLRQALSKTTVNAQLAADGQAEYARQFGALGINVERFLALPVERRLEALGRALVTATDRNRAYLAVTRLLGEEAGPRMLEVLERLGTEGFESLAAKIRESGELLSELDAQKLDALSDTMERWKTRALVVIGEVVAGLDDLYKRLTGQGINPEQQAEIDARARAIAQLRAEGAIPEGDRFLNFPVYAALVAQRTQELLNAATRARLEQQKLANAISDEADGGAIARKQAELDLIAAEHFVRLGQERLRAAPEQGKAEARAYLAAWLDELIRLREVNAPGVPVGDPMTIDPRELKAALDYGLETQRLKQQRAALDAEPGPPQPSVRDYVSYELGGIEGQFGDSGQRIAELFTGPIRGGLEGVRQTMQLVLGDTNYWASRLGLIGGSIMGALTEAVANLFAQWIAGRVNAFLISIGLAKSELVAAGSAASAASAIWATPATLATIATFGGAAAGAPPAIGASIAATQGLTALSAPLGPGRRLGGDVYPGTLYPINEDGRPEYFTPRMPGRVISAADAGGLAGNVSVAVFFDETAALGWLDQQEGRRIFQKKTGADRRALGIAT